MNYRDTFSLPEGEATIEWPSPMSQASHSEFCEWLALVRRKIKRTATDPYEDPYEDPSYGHPEPAAPKPQSPQVPLVDDSDVPF